MRLVRQVLQVHRTQKSSKTDLHFVGLAAMNLGDFHPREGQALLNSCDVLLVAGDAVKIFDKNGFKCAILRIRKQAQKAAASKKTEAALCSIGINADNLERVARRKFANSYCAHRPNTAT